MRDYIRLSVIAAALLTLTACGGGGSGGASTPPPPLPPPPPPPAAGGWVSGVFQAAANFKNKCASPRAGVDIEGRRFPDTAGTAVDEKNWLRSWTRETYLWNTEVTDRNPALAGTPVEYFDFMKTFALTASGRYKDEFHFTEPTSEYLARRNSVASGGYGASIVLKSSYVPREAYVVFTEPGTPASQIIDGKPALRRGSFILSVDGIDLVYGITSQAEADHVSKALFYPDIGSTHTFAVIDPGDTSVRTVTLTAEAIVPKAVNHTQVLNTETGKVGYIVFNTFSTFDSEKEIADAFRTVQQAGVTDLVLDLRYNGGGLLAVASQVSYMIAGAARTDGKTFEQTRFNALAGNRNPVTGEINTPIPFFPVGLGFSLTEGTALPALNLSRVYILSTESTCSASEAVINGLRGVDVEVVLIGGKTCGKPYGFYPQDNCGTTYYTIQMTGVNHKGFGEYADGFLPETASEYEPGVRVKGCLAYDGYERALGDQQESLLSQALWYRTHDSCPMSTAHSHNVPTAVRARNPGLATIVFGLPTRELKGPKQSFMQTNRDMTMPGGR